MIRVTLATITALTIFTGCGTLMQRPVFNPTVGSTAPGGVGAVQQTGAVNAQLNRLADDISGFKTTVGDMRSEITGVSTQLGSVSNKIGTLEASIGDVSARVGVFEAAVGDIDNKIGVVDARLRDVSTSITVANQVTAKGFETALENVHSEIGVIRTQLGDITVTNQAYIKGLDTKIGDISTQIGRDVNTSMTQHFSLLHHQLQQHGQAGRDLDQSINKYGGLLTGLVAVVALACAIISVLSMRKSLNVLAEARDVQRGIARAVHDAKSMQARSMRTAETPIYINWDKIGPRHNETDD